MKTFLSTILLCVMSIYVSFAQNRKKHTEEIGNLKEISYIDKKTGLSDGPYFMLNKAEKDTLTTGEYRNGIRAGIWNFYDSKTKNKKLMYDFSNDTTIFIDLNLYPDSFLVYANGNYIFEKVDQPLIFIGYDNELRHEIAKGIKVPFEAFKNMKNAISLICYVVDENGKLQGSKVLSDVNAEIEQSINTVVNSYSGRFIPAVLNGNPVKSMFMIKTNISDIEYQKKAKEKFPPYILEVDVFVGMEVQRSITTVKRETMVVPSGSFNR